MHQKQSVVIFSTAYLPLAGGAELAIKEITDRIHDVHFFLVTARMNRAYARKERIGNVLVFRVGIGVPFIDKLLLPMLGAYVAYTISRMYTVRAWWVVMISYASLAPVLLAVLGLRRTIPLVITLQEGDSEAHIARGRFGLIRFAWHSVLRHASRVQAISTYLAGLAKQYGYTRSVEIIPNGVDIEKFEGKSLKEKDDDISAPVIVTTSRLVKKNGIDILIRAFALVHEHVPTATLEIAGEGTERRALETLVHKMGLARAVIFHGYVAYDHIPEFLSRARVFVRPSRSEGLGTSFLEALAAGVPVVATPVGGIPDFLEDGKTGLFARVDDIDDIARQIIRLLTDSSLRTTLSQEGRKLVRSRYTWDFVAERMQTFLLGT